MSKLAEGDPFRNLASDLLTRAVVALGLREVPQRGPGRRPSGEPSQRELSAIDKSAQALGYNDAREEAIAFLSSELAEFLIDTLMPQNIPARKRLDAILEEAGADILPAESQEPEYQIRLRIKIGGNTRDFTISRY